MKWSWSAYMKRFLVIICVIALLATGCAAKSASSPTDLSQSNGTSDGQYGKVTSINGKELTLAIGTLNMGAPRDGTQSGKNAGGGASRPSGKAPSGSAPQKQPGSSLAGGTHDIITLAGETKVITISDDSKIVKANKGSTSSATLSDIKVGSILKFTMDGNTLKTVEIMQFGGRDNSAQSSSASSSSK